MRQRSETGIRVFIGVTETVAADTGVVDVNGAKRQFLAENEGQRLMFYPCPDRAFRAMN